MAGRPSAGRRANCYVTTKSDINEVEKNGTQLTIDAVTGAVLDTTGWGQGLTD